MRSFRSAMPLALAGILVSLVPNAEGETPSGTGCFPVPSLEARGLLLRLTYTGEVFHSIRTYPDGATEYRGLFGLYLALDTGKLRLWPGGRLFIDFQNGHGQGLTVRPGGVVFPVSDIDAQDFTEVYAFGIDQDLLEGALTFTLGKQDVNERFAVNGVGGDLIFPSFTLNPTIPMPTFPAPAFGATVKLKPTWWFECGLGAYEGNPRLGDLVLESSFDGSGEVFSILEPAWKPRLGRAGRYDGNYRVGFWYLSGAFPSLKPPSCPGTFDGDYGFYLQCEQQVYEESPPGEGNEGLGIFFQFGWTPSDRNRTTRYVGGGFAYKGLVPGREKDNLVAGAAYCRLVGNRPVPGEESDFTHMELLYVARLTSWLKLQPDFQYFYDPGGGAQRNSWALGLRFELHISSDRGDS
jgi:porin